MKNNKGISMITLVITIICMMILLGLAYNIGSRYIAKSQEEERTALLSILSTAVVRRQNDKYVGIGGDTVFYAGYHISSGDFDNFYNNFNDKNCMYEPGLWYVIDAERAKDLGITNAEEYLVSNLKSESASGENKYIAVVDYYTGKVELLKQGEVYEYVDDVISGSDGTGCEHTFSIVSCLEPSVCTKCGLVSVNALGHDFNLTEPTCTEDKKCNRCGYIEKKALGHDYSTVLSYNEKGHFNKCIRYDNCGAIGNFEEHTLIYRVNEGSWTHTAECTVCDWKDESEDCTIKIRPKDNLTHIKYCVKCLKEEVVEHDEIKKYRYVDEHEHIVYCESCETDLYSEEHIDVEAPYGICDKCNGVIDMTKKPEIKSVTMKNVTTGDSVDPYYAKHGDDIEVSIEVSMMISAAPVLKLQGITIDASSITLGEDSKTWTAKINTADYSFIDGSMSVEVTNVRSLWGVSADEVHATTDGRYIIYDATKPQYIYVPEG